MSRLGSWPRTANPSNETAVTGRERAARPRDTLDTLQRYCALRCEIGPGSEVGAAGILGPPLGSPALSATVANPVLEVTSAPFCLFDKFLGDG